MLPHTGLFLLWKVALQMRIRRPFKHITQLTQIKRFVQDAGGEFHVFLVNQDGNFDF